MLPNPEQLPKQLEQETADFRGAQKSLRDSRVSGISTKSEANRREHGTREAALLNLPVSALEKVHESTGTPLEVSGAALARLQAGKSAQYRTN